MTPAGAIEDALEFARVTPRERASGEGPWLNTFNLMRLSAAVALRRVGSDEAETLARQAFAHFEGESSPVVTTVLALYTDRLEQREPDVLSALRPLAAFDAYRTSRTLGASLTLCPLAEPQTQMLAPGQTTAPRLEPRPRRALLRGESVFDVLCEHCDDEPSALTRALQHSLPERALAGFHPLVDELDRLEQFWPELTDTFATSDLWCLTAFSWVDTIVFSIAEAAQRSTASSRRFDKSR